MKPRCVSGTGCRVLVSKRGCAFDILCMQNLGHYTRWHTPNVIWKLNKKRGKCTKLRQHNNHVGDGAPDVPPTSTFRIIVYPTNLNNPTTHGRGEHRSPVSFPHSTSWKIQTLKLLRAGCRGRQPLQFRICGKFWTRANAVRPYSYLGKSYLRKIAPLFAYLHCA